METESRNKHWHIERKYKFTFMSPTHQFQIISDAVFTCGLSEPLVTTASKETRADHLEVSLNTKVNLSPELSAARFSGWKRNAERSATKRVVHMTDHDRLTVFYYMFFAKRSAFKSFVSSCYLIISVAYYSISYVTTRRS